MTSAADHPRPLVAVTGATGLVGKALLRRLAAIGVVARPLARARDPRLALERADVDAYAAALTGASVVVHAAALVHHPNESDADRARFHRTNVDGTRAVAEAAVCAGVRRFVYVSTIGVYGPDRAPPPDESASPAPTTAYAATKWLGERALDGLPLETVVVRLATVFGPNDRENVARLARAVAGRRFVLPDGGAARKTLVHEDDAAYVLARLATEAPVPAVLHLGGHVVTVRALCDAIAARAQVPAPPSVPALGWLADRGALPRRLARPIETLRADAAVDLTALRRFAPEHVFADPLQGPWP